MRRHHIGIFYSALIFLIAAQSSAQSGQQFTGKLDTELSADLVHVYQRVFKTVPEATISQFVPPFAKKTAVSSGEMLAQPGIEPLTPLLVEPVDGDPLICFDLNNDGKIEANERFKLTPTADNSGDYGAILGFPISNQLYRQFPVLFRYKRGFKHPKLAATDRLTFQSVWAIAYGSVDIKGRRVRFQYPFELKQPSISTTEGLFGVDVDGDGKILSAEFSPETSYAAKTEVVFHVGDMYLSTAKIDLAKNEVVVRTRAKEEYLKYDIEVGKIMPDFSFVDLEGKTRNLSEYRGKYLLVDFWGVWCGDCVRETPFHVEAMKRFHSRGFDILGLDSDENLETLRLYLKKNNINWTQARNDSIRKLIEETYRIQEYPSTILIGPDAKVLVLAQRELHGESLFKTLDQILPK